MYTQLSTKLKDKSAQVAVIGLGYVGLPLATGLAKCGYRVTGLDASTPKVDSINAGRSYIPDVPSTDVAALVNTATLGATTDYETLREMDVIFICVPTPFDSMKAPDLSFVRQAALGIAPRLHAGQLVVLQSTTYPGTTEEVVQPILEESGLIAGQDFFLAFSPERIDPGRVDFTVENTPKVVGGINPESASLAGELLAYLTPQIHYVSTPRAAEMTKLLENIFRSVNIALVNELAILSERMGIDFWEVIEAAKTKPFGFMPFYPSPGVGGHCIPVDPYYLSWKAREYDFYTRFIELAAEVNGDMPYHTVELIGRVLNCDGKSLRRANILILGVAFKPNIDDARNSPAERVIELLIREGAKVSYHDPYVPQFRIGGDIVLKEKSLLTNVPLTVTTLSQSDCTVIITGHRDLDYKWIVNESKRVVDTVNATRHVIENRARIVRLGAPLQLKTE
ncbi:MAG: nucleotide sugar dehydrogenase [Anaerolineales bacterium]|nr:nucleotide sugar dehydrogenase [Anaerolineales bacterium]